MKRGDIFTAATGGGYGGKPRPVLIVQSDAFRMTSKTLVALIGSPVEGATRVRVEVSPDASNNLRELSHVMVDAILPVKPDQFGKHIGRLSNPDMRRVDMALLLFFGVESVA